MAFTRGDYVVRAGWWGVLVVLLGVLGWTALTVGVWLTSSRLATDVALVVFGAVFVGELVRRARPDPIPGAGGTVRRAYRRMIGWRANRGRLTDAVHRYAPGVPVIDGPDYPPSLSWREGLRAKRAKRSVNG